MSLKSGWLPVWLSVNSLSLFACQPEKVAIEEEQGIELPEHFPDWPEEHPTATAEQIELGRWLFYDRRLSRDGSRSCGICHEQIKSFSDGLNTGLGVGNVILPFNSPALFNVAWREELTWNRQFATVEEQMRLPLFAEEPVEMGMTEELLEARINDYPRYVEMFQQAFPDDENPISTENTISALASFTRSIISANSKYDHWLNGQESLSADEEAGRQLFFSERLGCSACHGGVFFDQPDAEELGIDSRHGYFNTGLYDVDGEGSYPASAQGLFDVTGNIEDMGRFRVPTLRNLDRTSPWMHDGSEISLDHIIRNYARGGRLLSTGMNAGDGRDNPYKSERITGFEISETEIEQLLAFLAILNDEELKEVSNLASPFCMEKNGEVLNAPCEPIFTIEE